MPKQFGFSVTSRDKREAALWGCIQINQICLSALKVLGSQVEMGISSGGHYLKMIDVFGKQQVEFFSGLPEQARTLRAMLVASVLYDSEEVVLDAMRKPEKYIGQAVKDAIAY